MTPAEARAVAAKYPEIDGGWCQVGEPEKLGTEVAQFAAGYRVRYERFMSDLDLLSAEYGFEAHQDIALLRRWAADTDADVWRD